MRLNFIEKAVTHSTSYRSRVTRKPAAGDLSNTKYWKPGKLYLWVDNDMVRAMLRYGDPHPNSLILKINTAIQSLDERRIIAKKASAAIAAGGEDLFHSFRPPLSKARHRRRERVAGKARVG
jgi:hypothetical protein